MVMAAALKENAVQLDGSVILITGASGLFGAWLIQCIDGLNKSLGISIKMVLLVRSAEVLTKRLAEWDVDTGSVELVLGSLENLSMLDHLLWTPTHIIHAASLPNVTNSKSWCRDHIVSSVSGFDTLIQYAHSWSVDSVLLTSSGARYQMPDIASQNDCRFVEEAAINGGARDREIYGETKRLLEYMADCEGTRLGVRIPIARCFAFIGPYLNLHANYAVGNFMADRLNESEIIISGDGRAVRSYLYLADLAIWLLKVLLHGEHGKAYNVGGEQGHSIKEIAEIIATLDVDPPKKAVRVNIKGQLGTAPDNIYLPDLERTKQELNCSESFDFEIAVQRTLAWYGRSKSGL